MKKKPLTNHEVADALLDAGFTVAQAIAIVDTVASMVSSVLRNIMKRASEEKSND